MGGIGERRVSLIILLQSPRKNGVTETRKERGHSEGRRDGRRRKERRKKEEGQIWMEETGDEGKRK